MKYGEITTLFGPPALDGAWNGHPLSGTFEVLDQQDANANRPFRTFIVISVDKNVPCMGFYEALERLKGTPSIAVDAKVKSVAGRAEGCI